MPVYDENDPKLAGYIGVEDFRKKDMDRSSRRIRDMPYGRRKEDGNLGPSEMSFGEIEVDDISPAQTAILHNKGYDDLPINGMSVVGDFLATTDCPASLAPGETCRVSVQFNPKRNGILTGGIYIDTGDAAGTEFIELRGTGEGESGGGVVTPPTGDSVASFSPTSLAFGSVEVGENSTVRSVTLSNTGDEPLVVSGYSVPTGFTITNNPATTIAAGSSTTISVRFSPTSAGARTGNLSVTHNGAGPTSVSLSGSGIAASVLPVISVSDAVIETRSGVLSFSAPSATISLGSAAFGETAEGTFYLAGSSEGEIEMTTLPASADGFTFSFATTDTGPFLPMSSFTIPQSGRMYVRARASGAPGAYSTTATFESANQTETVDLTATVEEEVVPVGMKRIRIDGNQFYEQEDPLDNGGNLPAGGGIRLASVNWFGAEGGNFTPHGTWMRNWQDILDQIKSVGFNCIRLPFSGSIASDPAIPDLAVDWDINPDFVGKSSIDVLEMIIEYCEEIELYVVLDHHRRSAGAGADGGPTDGSYSQADWLATWGIMANRFKDHINVVGADVHNEPHNLSWEAWATAAEACGNHILSIAPDWLIFIEGVGHIGDNHYWWGGQLEGVATRPCVLDIPNRVVYSPHEYGQSVGSQQWQKKDGNNPAGWPLNQAAIWDQFWGYIFYENIAPIWIGEMGGHFGLDANTGALTEPHRVEETEWMSHLVRYLDWDKNIDGTVNTTEAARTNGGKKGMSFAWWSWNPNSGDTGGIVQGDWETLQQPKVNLIQPLLDNI